MCAIVNARVSAANTMCSRMRVAGLGRATRVRDGCDSSSPSSTSNTSNR